MPTESKASSPLGGDGRCVLWSCPVRKITIKLVPWRMLSQGGLLALGHTNTDLRPLLQARGLHAFDKYRVEPKLQCCQCVIWIGV